MTDFFTGLRDAMAEGIPPRERWLHENPEALQAVLEGIADARAGRLVEGPDLDADQKLIESWEDADDIAAADAALADGQPPIPYEQVRAELGLDEDAADIRRGLDESGRPWEQVKAELGLDEKD